MFFFLTITMLIYLQTMQATMPNKGKGQEVQEVKKR